jgi:hypothetical protein
MIDKQEVGNSTAWCPYERSNLPQSQDDEALEDNFDLFFGGEPE